MAARTAERETRPPSVRAGRRDGRADHHLDRAGLGDGAPLGHGQVGAADADGHDGRARCGPTGRPPPPSGPRSTGPSRRVPSGNRTRSSPRRSTSSARWSASRSADSRWTGKAPDGEQQLAEPLVLPHLVLGHEEELALGAEGGEAEVGEGAVHRGQDGRPGRGDVLAPDDLGPEPDPERGDEEHALDPVQRRAAGVDLEGLVPPRRLGAGRRPTALGRRATIPLVLTATTAPPRPHPARCDRSYRAGGRPGASRRGEASRVESMRSRRATPSGASSWRRRARSSGEAVR